MMQIGIFADIQNIYYTTRQAYGRQFDYSVLWRDLGMEGEIVLANAYAIHRGDDKQLKFQNALKQIGFHVILKPYIQRSDGSAKGDWDVGITIDVMESAANLDRVVLLSGDGDFAILMDTIRQKYALEADVYGVPSLTSEALIRSASRFHAIDEHLLK